LAAYREWGMDCLPRLNGMFAFALWDVSRRQLLVARDRLGEKPLFYASLPGGGIVLASEMKALFAHPQLSPSADETAITRYIAGGYDESDELTMFRGVHRLPAAHALVIDQSGRIERSWRYWTPDFSVRDANYHQVDAVAQFREMLERSVSIRLRSDVSVGSSLSGGLDSSVIVGLVARMRDQRGIVSQNTFSGRFDDDPALSEGPFIDMVVKATGVNGYGVTPDPLRLIEESRALHYFQEEPFPSASIYLQWCVMRLARETSTTVILDGQGADELLAGYQYYFPHHQLDLVEQGKLALAVTETRAFSKRLALASRRYPDASRRFNPNIALGVTQLVRRSLHRRAISSEDQLPGIPPSIKGGRYRQLRAKGLLYNSLPQLLRYADRNAMAFSRETRLPFLDHELVDFVNGLPDRALVGDGWQKLILRRAAATLVPPDVVWRADKLGYAAPLDRWLRNGLKDWAHARVFEGPITGLDDYDRPGLEKLWSEHQAGYANHSWALWRWLSLNEWFGLLADGTWIRGLETRPAVSRAEASSAGSG
jgi:asparagine synthase (glutamine-hydrolysing)